MDELYDILKDKSFAISAATGNHLLSFLQNFCLKLLAARNIKIVLSVDNARSYQTYLPESDDIIYMIDSFIPERLIASNNTTFYYIYNKKAGSAEEQLELIEYMKRRTDVRYIFIGSLSNLSIYFMAHMFQNALKFCETSSLKSKRKVWYIKPRDKIFDGKICTVIAKFYQKQNTRKASSGPEFIAYDNVYLYDFIKDNGKTFKINPVQIKKRVSKNGDSQVADVTYHTPNTINMPDGTVQNYNNLVSNNTMDTEIDIIDI